MKNLFAWLIWTPLFLSPIKPIQADALHLAPKTLVEITEEKILTVSIVDSAGWSIAEIKQANTADSVTYLSQSEKELYYYLNLVRIAPQKFAKLYLKDLQGSKDPYKSSLLRELRTLKPMKALSPERKLFNSAKCHAVESGKRGYTGHNRFKCEEYFSGECCSYGLGNAKEIIISLLVDQGVSSLGHRKICLDQYYSRLGASIQPHKSWGVNAVLDFN
ncbi:MAG: CAP domain-containing protein [Bacteroidota bacterium]